MPLPIKITYAPSAYQAQMTTVIQTLLNIGFLNIIAASSLGVNPQVFSLLVQQGLINKCNLTGTYSLPIGTTSIPNLSNFFYFA